MFRLDIVRRNRSSDGEDGDAGLKNPHFDTVFHFLSFGVAEVIALESGINGIIGYGEEVGRYFGINPIDCEAASTEGGKQGCHFHNRKVKIDLR